MSSTAPASSGPKALKESGAGTTIAGHACPALICPDALTSNGSSSLSDPVWQKTTMVSASAQKHADVDRAQADLRLTLIFSATTDQRIAPLIITSLLSCSSSCSTSEAQVRQSQTSNCRLQDFACTGSIKCLSLHPSATPADVPRLVQCTVAHIGCWLLYAPPLASDGS